MTPLRQALSDPLQALKTRKQQTEFIHLLKKVFPDAIRQGRDVLIGNTDSAQVIVSVRYDRCIVGVHILCELLQSLSSTTRNKAVFVFTKKNSNPSITSDKLLIKLDGINSGDRILVSATKTARENYGAALKTAFRPTKTKSVSFVKARKSKHRFSSVVSLSTRQKKHLFVFKRAKTREPDLTNVKPVCDSILRFLRSSIVGER